MSCGCGHSGCPECGPRVLETVLPAIMARRKPLTVVCAGLGEEEVRMPGSPRMWRKCGRGYGSETPDERAGHCCGCATPTPGVWRVGHECGPACPGYAI